MNAVRKLSKGFERVRKVVTLVWGGVKEENLPKIVCSLSNVIHVTGGRVFIERDH